MADDIRRGRRSPRSAGAAAAIPGVALLLAACASFDSYSRENAERLCPSLYTCVVYDDTGRHLSPCWEQEGRKPTVYPGEPGWPFDPGVCPPAPSPAG